MMAHTEQRLHQTQQKARSDNPTSSALEGIFIRDSSKPTPRASSSHRSPPRAVAHPSHLDATMAGVSREGQAVRLDSPVHLLAGGLETVAGDGMRDEAEFAWKATKKGGSLVGVAEYIS